jgi:hypothetical protein
MISAEASWEEIVALILVAFLVCTLIVWPLMGRRGRTVRAEPTEPLNLIDPRTRKGLTDFLARHQIVGDADIRDGVVLSVVTVDRLHPVADRLRAAVRTLRHMRNPAASSLYLRDSMTDRFRLIDLDVEDLEEAVRLLQLLCKERRDD